MLCYCLLILVDVAANVRSKQALPFFLPGLEALLKVTNETKSWVPREKKRKAAEATEGDDDAEGEEKKQKGDEAETKKKEEPVVKMTALDDDGDDELMSPGVSRSRGRAGGRGALHGKRRGGRGRLRR